jgi:tRNA uridine 5-carbamoylmethylation protein Kti12
MKRLIIIRGPLGIGKSTISKLVAKNISGKYFSIDGILEKHDLENVRDEKAGCIAESAFIRANKILLPTLKENLEKDISVVVDGNFYWEGAIKHLIEELKDYEPIVFDLKARVEVCIERDSHRNPPHGEGAARAVHNLVSRFEYGIAIKNEDSDIDEKVNEIVSKIIQK